MFATTQSSYSTSESTQDLDKKDQDNRKGKIRTKPNFRPIEEPKKTTREIRTKEKMTARSSNERREYERDEIVLARRQKQIDFGKNTLAYDRYQSTVPKEQRTKQDPKTPLKHLKMNRRSWDGLIKNWKLKLHKWEAENPVRPQNSS